MNKVGLGTFPLANVFSKVTKKQAENIVKTFLDQGGYYIDTAPLYGFGKIEKLLSKVLKNYPRNKYYLITKCGYTNVEGKTFQTVEKSCKYKDVIRECERSLKRLRINCIDLYFVHSPDYETPFKETVRALTKLQKDGKIKEIGVSNVNLEELKEYNQSNKVKFIQNRFSLINQSIDQSFAKYLLEKNIKLIPYQPIDRGQLSDKSLDSLKLKEKDLRKGKSDWDSKVIKIIINWVKSEIHPLAKKINVKIEQLAIAWTLQQKYVHFPIVGATNIEQVKNNLWANKIKLSKTVLKEISKAYKNLETQIRIKYDQSVREFRGLNEKYY